ncbi:MAG: DUF6090 family protein [Christiangramia sp.]|uniref:DUF6090 family protein n=1 Tax=Christiangramia sp. TaxID=1931228 RepID=UPI003241DC6B
MAKLFRHIREKLARENRFTRYIVYAIGEIILVVIGILIALQINNWNEDRKEKIKEIKLLSALQEDFQTNQKNLQKALNSYPKIEHRLESQLTFLGNTNQLMNDSIKDFLSISGFYNTEIIESGLNVLLSSENLQLITKDSLKKHLTAYPSYISVFKKNEKETFDLVLNEHRPILEKHISLAELYRRNFQLDTSLNFITSDFDELIQDRDFQNVLVKEMIYIGFTVNQAIILLNKTEEILREINGELSKYQEK